MAAAYVSLMMNTRRHITNIRFAVPLLVLFLALDMPGPSSARLKSWESDNSGSHQHSLHSGTHGLTVDMLHYHHVDSPYAQPQLTMAERLKMAAEKSRKRADFIHAGTSRRSLQSSETSFVLSIPDYNSQASGEYLVEISLGTPPR